MGRVRWDESLNLSDFSICHYDRGKETLFAFALPEHRILQVKYREKVVWDKERRIDMVFGMDIYSIIEHYDEWKAEQERIKDINRLKKIYVYGQMDLTLGK